jgi:hypothetical protein
MRCHLPLQAFCSGVGLIFGATAVVAITAFLSVSEMTARADWIGVVRIVDVSPADSSGSFLIARGATPEILKGAQLNCADEVRIREGVGISTAVEYRTGEVRLVFLKHLEDCLFSTEASIQGALLVEGDLVLLAGGTRRPLSLVVEEVRVAMR